MKEIKAFIRPAHLGESEATKQAVRDALWTRMGVTRSTLEIRRPGASGATSPRDAPRGSTD